MKFKNLLNQATSDNEEESPDINIVPPTETWGPDTLAFFSKDSRAILVSGEVTEHLANCVVSQFLELASESDEAPIYVYINTEGGDVTAGLAIYDIMRVVPCPVITIVIGECYSAGLFILQGGDRRGALPHSSFFYHEPIASYHTITESATIAYTDHYKLVRAQIDQILQVRSKIRKDVWKKDFAGKTAFFFTAAQALEYKMIDEIVDYEKPKPLKIKTL